MFDTYYTIIIIIPVCAHSIMAVMSHDSNAVWNHWRQLLAQQLIEAKDKIRHNYIFYSWVFVQNVIMQ